MGAFETDEVRRRLMYSCGVVIGRTLRPGAGHRHVRLLSPRPLPGLRRRRVVRPVRALLPGNLQHRGWRGGVRAVPTRHVSRPRRTGRVPGVSRRHLPPWVGRMRAERLD